MLETATEGILLCNQHGEVLLANKSAASAMSETPEGVLGRHISCRNHREADAADSFPLKTGDSLALDGKALQRPLEIRVATLGTGPSRQWLVYLGDMADRKQTQEQLSYLARPRASPSRCRGWAATNSRSSPRPLPAPKTPR